MSNHKQLCKDFEKARNAIGIYDDIPDERREWTKGRFKGLRNWAEFAVAVLLIADDGRFSSDARDGIHLSAEGDDAFRRPFPLHIVAKYQMAKSTRAQFLHQLDTVIMHCHGTQEWRDEYPDVKYLGETIKAAEELRQEYAVGDVLKRDRRVSTGRRSRE